MGICSKPTELCPPELLCLLCSDWDLWDRGQGREGKCEKGEGSNSSSDCWLTRHAVITSMVKETKPEQKSPTLAVTLEKLETQFLY